MNLKSSPKNNTTVKESHPLTEKISSSHPNSGHKTYAQTTQNQSSYDTHPYPTFDIDKKISSFIDEFKSIINPLIALLTQVVSSLLNNKNDK